MTEVINRRNFILQGIGEHQGQFAMPEQPLDSLFAHTLIQFR